MPRIVRGGLIQATLCEPATSPVEKIKRAMIDKHVALIAKAAEQGRPGRSACRSCSTAPTSAPSRRPSGTSLTERVPDGPTTKLMCELAKKHGIVLVVPVYEEDLTGVYYNTAAVIDADGTLPRQVPQDAHPALQPGLLGEVLLPARQPRLSGVSRRASARSAFTSATTATSPKGPAAWA